MASIPFAISIHKFISSVGADVGFASIVALAILVLVYFSHVREAATLQDRLEETQTRMSGCAAAGTAQRRRDPFGTARSDPWHCGGRSCASGRCPRRRGCNHRLHALSVARRPGRHGGAGARLGDEVDSGSGQQHGGA
jgi:hypothetical protein